MNGKVERESLSEGAETRPRNNVQPQRGVATRDETELPALARRAVETFVRDHLVIEPPGEGDAVLLNQPAACFVSIKTRSRDLRGCIGTIEPAKGTLAEEIISNAVSAATRDPRFLPVSEAELPFLLYSVDVLSAPEPTRFDGLNPTTYGIIVEDEQGFRRGLLLPDIEGVKTPEQQVQIAARKAGIKPGTPLKLYRFRVRRFREPARPTSTQG